MTNEFEYPLVKNSISSFLVELFKCIYFEISLKFLFSEIIFKSNECLFAYYLKIL